VVDLKVKFYDGKSHEVDSSEIAFKIASAMALRKGVLETNPVLLEPIMNLEVFCPGRIHGRRHRGPERAAGPGFGGGVQAQRATDQGASPSRRGP